MAIELLNIDCMEYMKDVKDKFFDLAIVDPPYGIGINMNQGRRKGNVIKHTRKTWDDSCPDAEYWNELTRISKNQIVWGANNFPWIPAHNGWIVWDKDITGDVPFSMAELAYCSPLNTVQIVKIRAQSGAETYSNKIHPTQKPVQLYKWLLKNYAKEGDKILDTHGGSMSIALACHDYKFDLVLCEIDKDYFDAGVKRYRNHIAQTKLF